MKARGSLAQLKRFAADQHRKLSRIELSIHEFSMGAAELDQEIVAAEARAGISDSKHFAYWLAQGYRPGICLAVIAEVLDRKKNVSSLSYFDDAIREAHEKTPARKPNGADASGQPLASNGLPMSVEGLADERWKIRLDRGRNGMWQDNWGPAPGKPGCMVPAHLLERPAA